MSRKEHPLPFRGKLFDSLFDFLRLAPFSLALQLCFSLVITKWCKIYTKTDSWFQKSHEEFGQLQTGSGKSKKLKFDGLLLSKKYICPTNTFLLLKHYIQNIYLTLLSTTCVKIHQIPLCHFWSHKSFFTTPLVYIILVQALYTFDKDILSKCKFLDFLLLELKLIKFLVSLFKQKVSFSLNFGSLFSVMRDSSTFLAETVLDLAKRNPSMCKNSDFCLLTQYFTKIVLW